MIQFASVNKTVSGLERGGDGGGMIVDGRYQLEPISKMDE